MADRLGPSAEDIAGPAMPAHSTSAPSVSSPTTASASAVSPSPVNPEQPEQQRSTPQSAVAGPSSQYAIPPPQQQGPPRSFSPIGVTENTPFTAPYQYRDGAAAQGPPPGGYYGPQAAAGGYPPVGSYPYTGANPADVGLSAGVAGVGAAAAVVPAVDNTPKTFAQRMAGSDEHWQWKLSLRMILIVLDIIGIGAAAAVTAANGSTSQYNWFYFDDSYILPFVLIPLGVSFVWCLVVVLVLLLRRPPRAVHPGIAVGVDLVLWLALIFTLLFTVSAVLSLGEFGSDSSDLQSPYYGGSYGGAYSLAPNNSWVYVTSTNDYYYNYNLAKETATASSTSISSVSTTVAASIATTTAAAVLSAGKRAFDDEFSSSSEDPFTYSDYYDPYDSYSTDSDGYYIYPTTDVETVTGAAVTATEFAGSTATRVCTPEFSSCAQQDAFVNKLWHDKPRRYALDLLAAVVQGIALLLHFTLFVWACVDTHRRNRLRRTNAMTMDVLQDMRQRGYVMVPAAEGGLSAAAGGIPGQEIMYPYAPRAMAGGPGTPGIPAAWPTTAAASPAAEKAPMEASSVPRYG